MKRKAGILLSLVMVAFLCVSAHAAQAPTQSELAAITQKAERGDAEAQYSLGSIYWNKGLRGEDATQNYRKAFDWLKKSAEQGYAAAQNHLGVMYENGWGVAQDIGKAAEWYKKAAEQGNTTAQRNLEKLPTEADIIQKAKNDKYWKEFEERLEADKLEHAKYEQERQKRMADIREMEERHRKEDEEWERKVAEATAAMMRAPASQQGTRTEAPLSSLPRVSADTLERATVFVLASEGKKGNTGTGFFVAPGVIATNAHVVGSAKAKVQVINKALGSLCPAEIIAVSPVKDRDYALLRIPSNKAANAPVLRFAPKVRRADRVGTWGYPGAISDRDPKYLALMRGDVKAVPEVVYSEGVVSTLLEQKPPRIAHTAIISHGNSGGPLVNERGEVVGINTWIDMDKQSYRQTNLSLPSSDLADFMRKNGLSPRMAPAAP